MSFWIINTFRWVPSTLCLKFAFFSSTLFERSELMQRLLILLHCSRPHLDLEEKRKKRGRQRGDMLFVDFSRTSLTTLTPLASHLTARKTWQMNSCKNVPLGLHHQHINLFRHVLMQMAGEASDWCLYHEVEWVRVREPSQHFTSIWMATSLTSTTLLELLMPLIMASHTFSSRATLEHTFEEAAQFNY